MSTPRRYRGPSKGTPWRRPDDGELAVLPLALDVSDPATRHRLEQLFSAVFCVRRAVQGDARARCRAYAAAKRERTTDPTALRERLGLSRKAFERAAYRHLKASGHLLDQVSKAVAMHAAADPVWEATSRHLFPDAAGRRFGMPTVRRWHEFTTVNGRARSHTTRHKWETFRLVGTLAGHLGAYRAPGWPGALTPEQAAALPPGAAVLADRRMPTPTRPAGQAGWWGHDGPLAVVFTGGPASTRGDLVLPVRLPTGAGRWPRLLHYLGDPARWHKVNLVRFRDPGSPGGWRYEAHLVALVEPYAGLGTRARRSEAGALGRRAGVDGNVRNLSLVSLPAHLAADTVADAAEPDEDEPRVQSRRVRRRAMPRPPGGGVRTSVVTVTGGDAERLHAERVAARRRQRALDRSRRANNRDQYRPSKAQARRADRREAAGLRPVTVELPRGPRVANAAGVPTRAYRKDMLSSGYRDRRVRHAEHEARQAAARTCRARAVAAGLVATHGTEIVVEDCDVSLWARRWGRGVVAFTPGLLLRALNTEIRTTTRQRDGHIDAHGLRRASPFTTALSQHCLCGQRVPKTLADREHRCPACGLQGDRDLVSAALGAFVTLTDPDDPKSAGVDYQRSRTARSATGLGLQEALSVSNGARPASLPGLARRAQTNALFRRRVARRNSDQTARPTPDEPPPRGPRRTGRTGPHGPPSRSSDCAACLRSNS